MGGEFDEFREGNCGESGIKPDINGSAEGSTQAHPSDRQTDTRGVDRGWRHLLLRTVTCHSGGGGLILFFLTKKIYPRPCRRPSDYDDVVSRSWKCRRRRDTSCGVSSGRRGRERDLGWVERPRQHRQRTGSLLDVACSGKRKGE